MPIHKGWLPREGFSAEPIFSLLNKTALNPAVLLPILLATRLTKKGEDLSVVHPLAFSRLKTLFFFGLAKWLSSQLSEGVVNNWTTDTYDWPNEIAVVTGGAGGIGGHVVRLLAERGVAVVVLDIQPMTFEAGPKVHHYKCDLTSAANLSEVAAKIRAEVGDPTILVNNAGVARGKSILDTSEWDLKFTFDVNCFAHYYTVHEFLPAMICKNHGMVVTIASFAAWLTVPNMVDYGCSKAAAFSFHEGLTAELKTRYNAPKVRTVVVNQGYTKTALFTGYHNEQPFMLPALEPESVADAIATQIFSGKSGQIITPTLGWTLRWLRGLPQWYSYRLRSKAQNIMSNFRGRQVIQDVDKHYADREKVETEEGTVLVPEQK
ncbi:estradiol 17-beta-dehydrogenase [Pseudomassariella vexata]|uniref:Short-chain dehydrogenase/reductase 3 n=1 Tax=Pseudomassariella vexata TaxID=1141098 RepID=A0A1Y2E4G0_9PEZI|nr:estradiol 17-beta-dehydrogenase [Pseudomassariella vexata]ORY66412.1 estradiol 17-beta-dehydrogenase [Pseudomassariella vexata]